MEDLLSSCLSASSTDNHCKSVCKSSWESVNILFNLVDSFYCQFHLLVCLYVVFQTLASFSVSTMTVKPPPQGRDHRLQQLFSNEKYNIMFLTSATLLLLIVNIWIRFLSSKTRYYDVYRYDLSATSKDRYLHVCTCMRKRYWQISWVRPGR